MNDPITILPSLLAIVAIVLASVAGLRKTWPAVDGWRAVVAVVVVSLVLSTALAAYVEPGTWWRGLLAGVVVAIVALGGDQYLVRLAGKAATPTVSPQDAPTVPPSAPRDEVEP